MKTIRIDKNPPSVDELLAMARDESVLIVSRDGGNFLLEEADDFDREVSRLGNSQPFIDFFEKRSQEKGTITIDQLRPGRKARRSA